MYLCHSTTLDVQVLGTSLDGYKYFVLRIAVWIYNSLGPLGTIRGGLILGILKLANVIHHFDNRAADAHTTRVFHTKHMSFVLPITFHLIGKPRTISSTRPAT